MTYEGWVHLIGPMTDPSKIPPKIKLPFEEDAQTTSRPATISLTGRYEANRVNDSAGRLDGAERAGIAIALVTGVIATFLLFFGAPGIQRGEAFAAGLAMLTASATAARGAIKD